MLGDIPVTMERRKVKNLNLYVQPPEGRVLATIPWRMREADAIKFIRSKENWIRTAREKVRSRQKSAETPGEAALPYTKEEVEKLQKEIPVLINPKEDSVRIYRMTGYGEVNLFGVNDKIEAEDVIII